MPRYFMESRTSPKGDWSELAPGLFTLDETAEFFADLDIDDDRLFRRRMHPSFGWDTEVFNWVPPGGWQDEDCELARDMSAEVHALNDRVLSALGC